jgi:hypothetical protein
VRATVENLKKIVEAARAAAAAAPRLIDAEKALTAKIAELETERVRVQSALPSKEEVLANIDRLVDVQAELFAKQRASGFASALGGGTEFTDTTAFERRPALPKVGELGSPLSFPDWVALNPDAAKAALRRVVSGAKFGPGAAEKVKKLAEIDAAIETAEKERGELLEAMSALGLETPEVIAHRNVHRGQVPYVVGAVGFGSTPGSRG